MILERILTCNCSPDKIFKNNITFKAHLKTQKHKNYISNYDIKNYKKSSVQYENNITDKNLKLKESELEIKKLKKEIYLKNKYINFNLKNMILLIFFLNIKYSF